MSRRGLNRRSLLGLALAAGGVILGLRAWQGSSRTVSLRYEAPQGELTVTIRDADGKKLRRTTFGAQTERQHEMRLPDGSYRADLDLAGRPRVVRPFQVSEDAALLIDWRAGR